MGPVFWHFLFESLAYAVAFRLYLWERRNSGDFLDDSLRWNVVVAAIAGAVAGSRLLFWLEDLVRTWQHWHDLAYLMGGKTVVGGILGATIAVEFLKRRAGVTQRTGDLFAVPLAVGIAIGRVGCFLAGVHDDTHGLATTLAWGIDAGDGIRRHPVQLLECAAMGMLALGLTRVGPPRFARGDRFRIFLLAYFGWRLAIDFLKPGVRFGGMTALQWCCVAALMWYSQDGRRILANFTVSKDVVAHG